MVKRKNYSDKFNKPRKMTKGCSLVKQPKRVHTIYVGSQDFSNEVFYFNV